MTKEALRLALGALQRFIKYDYNENPFDGKDVEGAEAIAAIKEALAQPEQKPVAINQHRVPYCADWYDGIPDHHDGHGPYEVRTLYTTPPQRTWVSLTDEDWEPLYDKFAKHQEYGAFVSGWDKFARAIEAKLRSKNENR